jgi:hypothetical protein
VRWIMPIIAKEAKFRPLTDHDAVEPLRRRGAKRPVEHIDGLQLGVFSEAMTSGEPV